MDRPSQPNATREPEIDTCDHGYSQNQKCTGCMAEAAQQDQRTRALFAS